MGQPVALTGDGITFGHFRLDIANQCLWRGGPMVSLTPKAFAVLRCLIERSGQLVSKDELLDSVWPDAAVSDASLKVCVREIRRALGDPAAAPRYIATVHRRGYRFIGHVEPPVAPGDSPGGRRSVGAVPATTSAAHANAAPTERRPPELFGRDAALAILRTAFDRARAGARQIVFVTSELGIGKTALLEAFLADAAVPAGALIARGRCLEHFGTGEAYLPLLEAIGRICRERGAPATALLRERAPTWLMQMPWLIADADLDALRKDILGGTRQRMLREVTELLEAFAATTPLVLMLDDLHWSDPSTLDAVALLAQRSDPARLLVLGSYRPVDTILSGHPVKDLKQRLAQQRQCSELALDLLAPE